MVIMMLMVTTIVTIMMRILLINLMAMTEIVMKVMIVEMLLMTNGLTIGSYCYVVIMMMVTRNARNRR